MSPLPHIAGSLSSSNDESDLGAHVLSRRQRHRADDFRLARQPARPQALFHDLPGDVHRLLILVRHRHEPAAAHSVPAAARLLRWWPAAKPANRSSSTISRPPNVAPPSASRHRDHRRARDRSDARRDHHRLHFLALDFLRQRAGRYRRRDPGLYPGAGPRPG